MPEISLKDYLAKLDSALYAGSADEVIHHCRHILQFYPKNVAAYRYLGRALVFNARHEEATAALRRVLSVIPDDYAANLALSEAYDSLKRGDQAIWHLERAFEQQPNNRDLIEGVRSLYRRYRAVEPKIQLTSAAVARQHLTGGRYTQAIETLRTAVARTPNRVDLKLLLAQTLWKQGDDVAGAEAALDVLETLPDCLEANVMLAQLWLSEDRPSDAQRYLNRVESVDPYRALEIAQGEAPDDAFRLEELDYQRFAKSEAVTARPDWLTHVTGDAPAVTQDDQGEEWTRWQSGMLSTSTQAAPAAPTPPIPPAPPVPHISEPEPEEVPTFDFFNEPQDSALLGSTLSAKLDDDDPLAWLKASGVEIVDAEPEVPTFDDDFSVNIEAQSPTSWMEEHGIVQADEPALPADSDALAWLRSEMPDVLLDEPEESLSVAPTSVSNLEYDSFEYNVDSTTDQDVPPATVGDMPDWMQHDPAFAPPTGDSSGNVSPAADDVFSMFDTPAAEPPPAEAPAPSSGVPGPRKGLTGLLNSANLDWLPKAEPEPEPEDPWMAMFNEPKPPPVTDTPDWLRSLDDSAPAEPESVVSDDAHETEFDMPSDRDFDWLTSESGEDDEPVVKPVDDTAEVGFSFTEEPHAAPSTPAPAGDSPDWLFELTGEPANPSTDAPDGQIHGSMPDWLSELQPHDQPDDPEHGAAPATPSGDFNADSGAFDFNFDDQPAESPFGAAPQDSGELVSETPDWLSELQPEGETDNTDDNEEALPAAEPGSGFNFDDEDVDALFADAPQDAGAVASGIPDWLTELQPDGQPSDADAIPSNSPSDAFAFDDSDEVAFDSAPQDTGALASDIPDWLANLQPESGEQPETDESAEPAIIADPLAPDSSVEITESNLPVGMGAMEQEPAPVDDTTNTDTPTDQPDELAWMTEAGESLSHQGDVAHDLGVLEGDDDEIFAPNSEWATDDLAASIGDQVSVTNFDEPAAPMSDLPDWLSEMQPEPEQDAAQPESAEGEPIEAEPADLSFLSSYDDFGAEPGATPQPVETGEQIPDWLLEMETEDDSEDQEPAVVADALQPDSSIEITESNLPEGMGATEEEPAPVGETGAQADDEFAWLNESGDSLEHQGDVAHDLGVLEGDEDEIFAPHSEWATDDLAASVGDQTAVVPEEAPEPVSASSDVGFDEEGDLEEANAAPVEEAAMTSESGHPEELAHEAAANVPDWLNAIIPGIDTNAEDLEEESVESAFVEEPGVLAYETRGSSSADDFVWLNDIVEEETRETLPEAPPMLPETPGTPAQKSRFAFTRRPEWLKFSKAPAWLKSNPQDSAGSPAPSGTPANAGDDFPDWPEDDPNDQNELPDWLKK